jgi:hypothetical protein
LRSAVLRSFHTKSIDINNCEWQSVPDMDCDLAAQSSIQTYDFHPTRWKPASAPTAIPVFCAGRN